MFLWRLIMIKKLVAGRMLTRVGKALVKQMVVVAVVAAPGV